MRTARTALRRTAVILAIFIFVGYAAYQSNSIMRGSMLRIENPAHGDTLSQSLVTVAGQAAHAVAITLNDRSILIDEHGGFREPVLLSPGYNVVTVLATDRFGRTKEETLALIYAPQTAVASSSAVSLEETGLTLP